MTPEVVPRSKNKSAFGRRKTPPQQVSAAAASIEASVVDRAAQRFASRVRVVLTAVRCSYVGMSNQTPCVAPPFPSSLSFQRLAASVGVVCRPPLHEFVRCVRFMSTNATGELVALADASAVAVVDRFLLPAGVQPDAADQVLSASARVLLGERRHRYERTRRDKHSVGREGQMVLMPMRTPKLHWRLEMASPEVERRDCQSLSTGEVLLGGVSVHDATASGHVRATSELHMSAISNARLRRHWERGGGGGAGEVHVNRQIVAIP